MTDGYVPRGTRLRGLQFRPEMVAAIAAGEKTETRRLLNAANSEIRRADFDALQLDTARGDALVPMGGLRARAVMANGALRTVQVSSRVRPLDLFWVRSVTQSRRQDRKWCLEVLAVSAVRLQDVTEEQCRREGIRQFRANREQWDVFRWPQRLEPSPHIGAYLGLLLQLGRRRQGLWLRTELHREALAYGPSARACFALLWEVIHGQGAWGLNPWVWRYQFERVDLAPDDALATRRMARSDPFTEERQHVLQR